MIKNFNIKVGNYEVVSTGTIIGILNEPITFNIENLVFEFQFRENPETNENMIFSEIPKDNTRLILYFENFNNSLGTGNLEPMQLATLNNRPLLFNYRVYSLANNSGKMLHYTWLLGNPIKGGSK